MTTIHVIKTASGALVPANEESAEAMKRFKIGNVVKVEATQMRNGRFFRKWWALAQIAYDMWKETAEMPMYKGETLQPCFEKFRKDLTIMAGYYQAVVNIRCETRLEAKSIAWSQMDESEFEKLYSATITVVLGKILRNSGISEDQLRGMVDQVLEFA